MFKQSTLTIKNLDFETFFDTVPLCGGIAIEGASSISHLCQFMENFDGEFFIATNYPRAKVWREKLTDLLNFEVKQLTVSLGVPGPASSFFGSMRPLENSEKGKIHKIIMCCNKKSLDKQLSRTHLLSSTSNTISTDL